MKRRSFVQYVLGLLGIGVTGLPAKADVPEVIIANGTGAIQTWESNTGGVMDVSPDSVVSLEKMNDSILVFCECSIWEMRQDSCGNWHSKQLSYN